ncbi:MAG TPA: MauE/DoxX family redox-associated membrane protein [Jatrophihabitans sp.]
MDLKKLTPPALPTMRPFNGSDWLGTLVRLALGVILLVASLPKLANPRGFKQTARAFDFGPDWIAKGAGYVLPTVLLLLGALLILGLTTRVVAAVALIVTVVFVLTLLQGAARGLHVDAGVFDVGGPSLSSGYAWQIPLAVVLLLAALYLVLWPYTRIGLDEFVARNDYLEEPSAKRLRDAQGRRKYERDLAVKQRAARVRSLWLNSSVIVVGIAALVMGMAVLRNNSEFRNVTPVEATSADNGYVYGKQAAATVDIYEDFFSADAATLEQAVSKTLVADAQANLAQVRYHMIASLDHSADGTGYSTRAANAALCMAAVSSDEFIQMHDLLFGKDKSGKIVRPNSQSGVSVTDFTRYGTDLGLTTEATTFRDCVSGESNKKLVQAMTEIASTRGVGLTPVVLVNGTKLEKPDLASLKDAIAKANVGATPKPSATPTPSASGSGSSTASPSATSSATPTKSASTSPKPSTSSS